MSEPRTPTMGDLTDLGICNWIAEACKQTVGPKTCSGRQIAFKAAVPQARDLEEWAWPELTVQADHYSKLNGSET